jgi:hypothetical protein
MPPVLALPPDQTGYRADYGQTGVAVQLDGGASRFRADQLGAAFKVAVQWTLNKKNYEYLAAFFRTSLLYGNLSFQIDLILDSGIPSTYVCHIMPGTFALVQQMGQTYIVGATLEADYDATKAAGDAAIIAGGIDA